MSDDAPDGAPPPAPTAAYLSGEGSVKGRWQPNASAAPAPAPKPAARSEAAEKLAAQAKPAAPAEPGAAEARAAAIRDMCVDIKGESVPLAELQAAKKGVAGRLAGIDFDLKHSYLSEAQFSVLFEMPYDVSARARRVVWRGPKRAPGLTRPLLLSPPRPAPTRRISQSSRCGSRRRSARSSTSFRAG
jgi:hypothetical protein